MTETLSESIRRRIRERAEVCPTCGQATTESLPLLATKIGINYTTFWRFVVKGKSLSMENLDRVAAWLEKV